MAAGRFHFSIGPRLILATLAVLSRRLTTPSAIALGASESRSAIFMSCSKRLKSAFFADSESIINCAEITTSSPASRPRYISTESASERPLSTGTERYLPLPVFKTTRVLLSMRISASRGISRASFPSGVMTTRVYIPGIKDSAGLVRRIRTCAVRVFVFRAG